jgi:hypothetical protein
MTKKGITTMSIIGLIALIIIMVVFASFVNSLNIQENIKHILWFVEVILLLVFIMFTLG